MEGELGVDNWHYDFIYRNEPVQSINVTYHTLIKLKMVLVKVASSHMYLCLSDM